MATKQKTPMTIRIELEENILRRFKALGMDKDTVQMQELRVIEMKQLREEVEKPLLIRAFESGQCAVECVYHNWCDDTYEYEYSLRSIGSGQKFYNETFEQ